MKLSTSTGNAGGGRLHHSHNYDSSLLSSNEIDDQYRRQPDDSMNTPTFSRGRSLRAHKALPRGRVLVEKGALNPGQKHVDHRSKINEPRLESPVLPSDPTFRLPLTPPLMWEEKPTPRTSGRHKNLVKEQSALQNGVSALTPSINQRSPPTPDITPPANQTISHTLCTPPLFSRCASSKAESFTTAREEFSDEETEHFLLSRKGISKRETSQITTLTGSRNIGLGLGLGLGLVDDAETPVLVPNSRVLGSFDGSLDHDQEVVNDPFFVMESASVTGIKAREASGEHYQLPSITLEKEPRFEQRSEGIELEMEKSIDNQESTATPICVDIPQSSLKRGLSLRERIEKSKNSPLSPSEERFASEIQWPSEGDETLFSLAGAEFDEKRFSQVSVSSTVVEVMVLETPPRRRQTLRHTYRNESLRTASSPTSDSNRSSFVSDGPKHRLVHRNTKITDRGNRISLNSDSGISMGSSSVIDAQVVIPVAVVPIRRSSLKHRKRLAPDVAKRYSRPNTAPELRDALSDPHHHLRTMSDLVGMPKHSTKDRKPRNSGPLVPARSSSLSAPTSRNVSRSTSLTSTSLHVHNSMQTRQSDPSDSPMEAFRRHASFLESPEKPVGEEWLSLRPPSHLLTPFSSMSCSTPGTHEVNEATAISIYPHTNKSILVVQQVAPRSSEESNGPSTLGKDAGKARMRLSSASGIDEAPGSDIWPVSDPLRSTQLPDLAVIPPTPANGTSSAEVDRQLTLGREAAPVDNGPFSKVRRALSTRRYSESFVSPLARSLSRRRPSMTRRPTIGEDPDNKLSPFWRPRGFWDDLSDDEYEGALPISLNRTPRLPPPKQPLLRRFTSLRVRRRSQSVNFESNNMAIPTRNDGYFPRQPYSGLEQSPGLMSRFGYPKQLATVLQERFERMRTRAQNGSYEDERTGEHVRANMSPVVLR